MAQQENFVLDDAKQIVCKLKKYVYGFKQAYRQWYYKFYRVIVSFGFEQVYFEAIRAMAKRVVSL